MTAIQLAAVIGFVVTGFVLGAGSMHWLIKQTLNHSTVKSLKWITCDEGHLHGVKIVWKTPMNEWTKSFKVTDDIADDIEGVHDIGEDEPGAED